MRWLARLSRIGAAVLTLSITAGLLSGCFGSSKTPGGEETPASYSVSGRITDTDECNKGIENVTVLFSGGFGTSTTDSEGKWSKDGLRGTVTVTPNPVGWVFSPVNREVTSASSNVDFEGTRISRELLVPSDYPTIQAAIDSARNGDVIVVSQGSYRENIDFKGKRIIVKGTDSTNPIVVTATVIDGGSNGPVVTFKNNESSATIIEGFTITNGWGSSSNGNGGGIAIQSASPLVRNNAIIGNKSASQGGGIYVYEGSPTITNNTIAKNEANDYGGGIHVERSSLSLIGNSIESNYARTYGGGGVSAKSSVLSMTNNALESNRTSSVGGGLYMLDCDLTIVENLIASNTALDRAGGLYVYGSMCRGEIRSNTIVDNKLGTGSSGWGGGVYLLDTSDQLLFEDNTILQNTADRGGGVVLSHSKDSSISRNVIASNEAIYGGGVYIHKAESVTLNGNEIVQNSAAYGGGGGLRVFDSQFARIRIIDNRFEGNEVTGISDVSGKGGAILTASSLTQVIGNEFVNNKALGVDATGGAIYVSSVGRLLDDEGNPLPRPDTRNSYVGNVPNDVHYE